MTTTGEVTVAAAYFDIVLGERSGFLAVAFGHDPYRDASGRYQHRTWTERRYPWPVGREQLDTDVVRMTVAGERADVYVCPAVRFTDDRRKGSALPPTVCWADLDGPIADEALMAALDPFLVESGSEGHRHVYVPLTRPVDLGMHARMNKALAARLGGDAKWSDEALLRLPGTLNHKTDPPVVVTSLPWSGRVWDPGALAALLGVDPVWPTPDVNGSALATAELAPNPLPALVRCALEHPGTADRSAAHHRLMGACHDAGLSCGQALTVAVGYAPSREKYGDRLAAEVARSWEKVRIEQGVTDRARRPLGVEPSANGQNPAAEQMGQVAWQGLDLEFWRERPVFQHIHDFAESREVSPWAVLGCVLVGVIVATSHRVVLPSIIGGFGSLNMFLALVGESGDGKGGAMSLVEEVIDLSAGAGFDTHSLGTGQGIAHGYAHLAKDLRSKKYVVERHADSVMFIVEEIDHLAGHAAQNGSTVLAELCRLYMGERLGHLYVDPTKRMPVDKHSYRGVLIAGVQPGRAGVLINAADGGTPQRFLWLPTLTPPPEVVPAEPTAPWPWKPPQWASDSGRVIVEVPECVVSAVKGARRARRLGMGDSLDGHRLFCQEKVAAAFAILDGRRAVSEDDWRLAERLMAVSDATRAEVVAKLAAKASRENRARGKAQGEREVAAEGVKEKDAVARVARSVLRILGRNGEWMMHSELRKGLSGTAAREYLPAAVAHLEAVGQVICGEVECRGQVRRRYRLAGNSQ